MLSSSQNSLHRIPAAQLVLFAASLFWTYTNFVNFIRKVAVPLGGVLQSRPVIYPHWSASCESCPTRIYFWHCGGVRAPDQSPCRPSPR
ncbi:hypothetical protein B0H21DRAFT_486125 [Amylocystis lapponica]|nr:hypothetical protein B0H21DRAFT_486125 [Amylocystis lapponica]